jgi:hypothetical protein
VISLLYVDNTGIRSNCPQLIEKFHADVRANVKIDLTLWVISAGSWECDIHMEMMMDLFHAINRTMLKQ